GSTTGAGPVPGGPAVGAVDDWPVGSAATGAAPAPEQPQQQKKQQPGKGQGKGQGWTRVETTQQFPAPGVPQGTPQAPGTPSSPPQGKGKKRGPKAPAPAPAPQPNGEALVSGVPPVTPARKGPIDSGAPRVPVPKPKPAAAAPADAGAPKQAVPKPAVPKPPAPKPAAAKSAPKSAPKKKGRSKLVLAGGAIVGLVGLAYGAGLLLDHADVPNGTTVLGVGIGGMSKEQAVQKLDSALGDRATAPLKVTVGGKTGELKPSVAGLSIDTQATVRAAAGRDYNPLTVIGSLVGGTRKAEPTVVADEEKIADALKRLAGETGVSQDGTIKFEPGKAVAVYGKPHQGLDVDKAVAAVSGAYRDRAATGQDKAVELPSSDQQPKVSNAEVDRMMKSFAEPAMSGLVTVQTDPAHKIQFGPERSLPKILSVKEVNGKLVDNYDLDAVKELYGSAFNGVLIQRGDGTRKPVTPQDVVGALRKALLGKTPAERVGVINVNGG
ncbi:hypothetical protein AB0K09_03145, partial [Streptomyces sp. NPDC049577]